MSTPMSPTGKSVMVTGANGFLGSHLVQALLAKGHTVHGCVRDKDSKRVGHLLDLEGAKDRLHLFSTGDLATASFDGPMKGCAAVMHAATPLSPKFGQDFDGERDIYNPAMASTKEVLRCIERCKDTVECLILTSSMSAVAPHPEPDVKDETHWSDSEQQRSRGNWYGCTKTEQEKLVQSWVEESKNNGILSSEFKYAAICPTMIVGPILAKSSDIGGTMGTLLGWFKGSRTAAPNDSMSFIHVDDCAAMHVAAMELSDASGRYMSLVESLHWNDILKLMKELRPSIPEIELYDGQDKVKPTKFNLDKMRSLGVSVKSVRELLQDSLQYFQAAGALD